MCDGFNHGALQIAVAQICQSMGWDSLQKSTHDLLTDVLQKYLEEIAKSAHGYCQLCKLSYIYIISLSCPFLLKIFVSFPQISEGITFRRSYDGFLNLPDNFRTLSKITFVWGCLFAATDELVSWSQTAEFTLEWLLKQAYVK